MAAATAFNLATNIEAVRKMYTLWVNTGTTGAKVWECVGVGVEDSALEFNADFTKTTDILGVTRTQITKFEPEQSFEPCTLRGGSPLQFQLFQHWLNDRRAELCNYEVMLVFGFIDGTTAGTYVAALYSGSAVIPQSIGGSAYVDMPITITPGGTKLIGSATKYLPTDTPVWATT